MVARQVTSELDKLIQWFLFACRLKLAFGWRHSLDNKWFVYVLIVCDNQIYPLKLKGNNWKIAEFWVFNYFSSSLFFWCNCFFTRNGFSSFLFHHTVYVIKFIFSFCEYSSFNTSSRSCRGIKQLRDSVKNRSGKPRANRSVCLCCKKVEGVARALQPNES